MQTLAGAGLLERVRALRREDSGMRKVHFVGIGGIGMSGLARCLLAEGVAVTGSDMHASEATRTLEAAGAHIGIGHAAAWVADDVTCVVRSAAIKDENVELGRARTLGVPVLKYAQLLGQISEARRTIAVSGCHGKTTTTAMIAHILERAGCDPSYVVGGVVPCLGGSSRAGAGRDFVVEACEFDRSFHNLAPHTAIITNIEEDHLDYYRDLAEIVESFGTFAALVPAEGLTLANADDPRALAVAARGRGRLETFSTRGAADWTARMLEIAGGRRRFEILRAGRSFATCRLAVPGRHNVANALAAVAAAAEAGVPAERIASALESFGGVARRIQLVGEPRGVAVIDDYGHHPTEIRTVISALREMYPERRLWFVFQPHQHSRTRHLLDGFAAALAEADRVLLPDIYGARDSDEDRRSVSSALLAERIAAAGGHALYLGGFDAIREHLRTHVAAPAAIVTMGAGDITRLAPAILRDLA